MDHSKIIKKSFQLVFKNKFLWLLGFLGGNSFAGYSFYGFDAPSTEEASTLEDGVVNMMGSNTEEAGAVLGEKMESILMSPNFWIGLFIVGLILFLVAVYLSVTARGAIVKSANELDSNKHITLRESWAFGHRYFWRRLSFSLIIFLTIVVLLTVVALPVILLAIFDFTIVAVITGILFGLVLLGIFVYLALIFPIAERYLFLKNTGIIQSLSLAARLFNRNWINFILLYLILFAISAALALGMGLAVVVSVLIVVGVTSLITNISAIASTIFIVLMAIILIIALCVFVGIKQAFDSVALTLSFRDQSS